MVVVVHHVPEDLHPHLLPVRLLLDQHLVTVGVVFRRRRLEIHELSPAVNREGGAPLGLGFIDNPRLALEITKITANWSYIMVW